MRSDNMKEIFKDIKVIELSSVLAGPLIGTFFAEFGAEVIKIENKRTGGDATRNWYLKDEEPSGKSAYYKSANYGKKSILLDLRRDEDRSELYEYVKDADILINNIRLSSAKKLGIHPSDIAEIKEDIIYAQLDGFDGNMKDRVAYDIALQAETGYLSMTGTSEGELAKIPIALIDILAAHQLKEAILIALIKRMKEGSGTFLRASLYGVALTSQKNQATNYLLVNHIPKPMGTLHPNIAPYGEIIEFKDGMKIVLGIGSNKQFNCLLKILNIEELLNDERFNSNSDRINHRTELYNYLQNASAKMNFEDIKYRLDEESVPYGRILELDQVWDSEEAKPYYYQEERIPYQSAVTFAKAKEVE